MPYSTIQNRFPSLRQSTLEPLPVDLDAENKAPDCRCSDSHSPESSLSLGESKIPFEENSHPKLLSDDPETAASLHLLRGQYRTRWTIPYEGEVVSVHDKLVAVPYEDELKRVFIYKLDVIPLDEQKDGQNVAQVTCVYRIIDNQLPIAAIAWGITALVSTVGGWFVIDKAEEFTGTGVGSLVTILTIATAALGLYGWVKRS